MPQTPKLIFVDITSGVKGQSVTFRNRTTGGIISTTIPETAVALIDCNNFEKGFTEGDVVDISVSGERLGSTSVTLTSESADNTSISTSAITSGLIRGIR